MSIQFWLWLKTAKSNIQRAWAKRVAVWSQNQNKELKEAKAKPQDKTDGEQGIPESASHTEGIGHGHQQARTVRFTDFVTVCVNAADEMTAASLYVALTE